MKRLLTGILMLICFGLTGFAGVTWINNIYGAVRWYVNVRQGQVDEKIIGPIAWLNWFAVDCSTITTCVPFIGLLFIGIGLGRIIWKRTKTERRNEYFPFFPTYSSVMITLGLIGTVWGLIMIGYIADPEVKNLTGCLHTALYSTLIAFFWVYLIALPIKNSMQWWDRKIYGWRKIKTPLKISLEKFNEAISVVTNTVENAAPKFEDFVKKLEEVAKASKDIRENSKIFNEFKKQSKQTRELLKEMFSSLMELHQRNEELHQRNEELHQRNEEIHQSNRQFQTLFEEEQEKSGILKSRISGIRKLLQDRDGR